MKRRIISALTCLLLAAPVWGGTVYVPLVLDLQRGDHLFTTEVRVTNNSDQVRDLTYLFLPSRSDGTEPDRSDSIPMRLLPRETELLSNLSSSGQGRGILEITADTEISVSSRLVSQLAGGGLGPVTEIPVLTSENLRSATAPTALQGWRREGSYTTDFYVLNLDHVAASCQIAVYRRSGALVTEQTIPVQPLSLQYFEDVLVLLGEANRDNVSAMVSCDRQYHAFAVTLDKTTGDLAYISPSGTGASMLEPPGDMEPPPPAVACPSGAIFRRDNAFHRPTPGRETRRFEIPMNTGQIFTRIEVDVDFTPDDWADPADGNHAVFWLNRTEKWASNVFGYVNVFGPGKNFGKISTNVGKAAGATLDAFKTREVTFQKGVTYHVHYVYDTTLNLIEAVFTVNTGTANEREVGRATGSTRVNQIRSQAPGFFIYFGHPTGTAGPEVRTYDWLYSNLCVQMK